jgi:multidrug efflux system outer membrane protein
MNMVPSTAHLAKKCLGTLLPLLLMGGCVVGPDYHKPDTPVPAEFRAQVTPAESQSFADLPWWSVFNDTALQGLITKGLTSNYDLRIAVSRIEQARAQVDIVESEGNPQVGYGGTAEAANAFVPTPGEKKGRTVTYGRFEGLLNAAWELDLWGRIRHATESAEAHLLGQEDVRRGVMLTLVSDLAADYFRLLELDQELSIAQESARTYKNTLDLFRFRYEAGKDSRLPVERAQAAYEFSNATIHELQRQIGQLENAISTLVGDYPRPIQRGRSLREQSAPRTPTGSTTALLQRRPDILNAEQGMIAANADIGVAVANFFPRIGLSAFLGGDAVNIASAWQTFGVWNLALNLAGPIYSGGRLEAAYQERQAYWDETVSQYKLTVLTAFKETSDALIAQQTLAPQRISLQAEVAALRHSAELALMRYDAGRASYFEVLEAQQQLFPAEDALAQTERDQLVAVVNLYKALGGGWDQREVRPVDQTASTDVSVHAQPIANQVSAPAPAIGSVEQQHAAPGGGK